MRNSILVVSASLTLALSVPLALKTQSLQIIDEHFSGRALTMANDYLAPIPGPIGLAEFDLDSCLRNDPPFINGLFGSQSGQICDSRSKESVVVGGTESVTSSRASNTILYDGSGSSTLTMEWYAHSHSYTNSLDGYAAWTTSDFNSSFEIDVSGIPPATVFVIHFQLEVFSFIYAPPENIDEDSARVETSFVLAGTDLTDGNFDFSTDPLIGIESGFNQQIFTGVITGLSGQTITIAESTLQRTGIAEPGEPYAGGSTLDYSEATSIYRLTLSINPIDWSSYTLDSARDEVQFSVDIGSDAELSELFDPSNNVFDPGDAYLFGGPFIGPGGADGVLDDGAYFYNNGVAIDIPPLAPDGPPITSGAPIFQGSLDPLTSINWLNMDGMDALDFKLTGAGSLEVDPTVLIGSQCVYRGPYFYISMDDDSTSNYTILPDIPIMSGSALRGETYGKDANKDEVSQYILMPYTSTTPVGPVPIWSESDMHVNMAPSPDIDAMKDDDVDALDITTTAANCAIKYVTVDHQAKGHDINQGTENNPGSIYQWDGISLELAVDAQGELGLPIGTDIDAFEFGYLWDEINQSYEFGLLFSVDVDDHSTPIDESGGLDPGRIYASFYSGSDFGPGHFDYTGVSLGDNIDALSIYPESFSGTVPGDTLQISLTGCQAPSNLYVVEIGFTSNNPRVNATWNNPEGTSSCELRGGRISDSTAGTLNPQFNNINNTRILSNTTGSGLPFNIKLYNNPNINFVPGKTYGYEARCMCSDGSGFSSWSGITPSSTFVVPVPPPSIEPVNTSETEQNIRVNTDGQGGLVLTLGEDMQLRDNEELTVQLYTVEGRLLDTRILASQNSRAYLLDLGLSPGTYILEVMSSTQRMAFKVVL